MRPTVTLHPFRPARRRQARRRMRGRNGLTLARAEAERVE